MHHVRALIALVLLASNLTFWLIPVTLLALASMLLPVRVIRNGLRQLMEWVAIGAISLDSVIWRLVSGVRIVMTGGPLPRLRDNCIVMANHQSWADILILQKVLLLRTPPLKWLVKRELLFVPIIGLICWAYGYPLLHRIPEEQLRDNPELRALDQAQVRAACAGLLEHPGTLMNFPEGTRYTSAKATRRNSPYEFLLPPRSGGMYTLVNALDTQLAGVIDITIQYPRTPPTLWDFLGGLYPEVRVRCEYIPRSELPTGTEADRRAAIREWLRERWLRKDAHLAGFLDGDQPISS